MNHEHSGITPTDLIECPELAVLEVLDSALKVAKFALLAAHPELTDTDTVPSCLETLAADHFLSAADALQQAMASYRSVIKREACRALSELSSVPF
jgi:hypothetical protein